MPTLPFVVGPGAAAKAREFLAVLDKHPAIRDPGARLDPGRRAALEPAAEERHRRAPAGERRRGRADTLARLDREKSLLSRDIVAVDLRLADRLAVRLSDAAAQAREDALKKTTEEERGRCVSDLSHGLAPKMKPISRRRSAIVCALDIGTSKIVCAIARLKPRPPQDVLPRRTHAVEVLGIGHAQAQGMKSGTVVDIVAAEEMLRHAVDGAERAAGVHVDSRRAADHRRAHRERIVRRDRAHEDSRP